MPSESGGQRGSGLAITVVSNGATRNAAVVSSRLIEDWCSGNPGSLEAKLAGLAIW
jgi:hypothetical protein